jgi:hypothetical protein
LGRSALFVVLALLTVACDQGEPTATGASDGAAAPSSTPADVLAQFPPDTRISTGGGEPRTADNWVMWSTCGENSQAATAEQNGGRDAGWVLVDDLLADPGLALGGQPVSSCEQAVGILLGSDGSDAEVLASQSLTAELNLSVGAESCPAAEGVVQAARTVLGSPGATDASGPRLRDDQVELARELSTLLAIYNAGGLCT